MVAETPWLMACWRRSLRAQAGGPLALLGGVSAVAEEGVFPLAARATPRVAPQCPCPTPESDRAGHTEAASGKRRSDRCTRAELRGAGGEAGCDAGAEDAETEQRQRRQHKGKRILQ